MSRHDWGVLWYGTSPIIIGIVFFTVSIPLAIVMALITLKYMD